MKKIVSIQGVKGAFHYQAAQKYFGKEIQVNECKNFKELVETVELGFADFGIMAIENSLVGNILQNYALLRESKVLVVGEVYLRVVQNLIALPGENITSIIEIHSHPMALAQCENYLADRKGVKILASNDTAQAAKLISENKLKGVAAIASIEAAREYGLAVIDSAIETHKSNYTRFLVLSLKPNNIKADFNKASVVFAIPHKTGSLQNALHALSKHNINLTMLQSLPQIGHCWEYFFHADMVFPGIDDFNMAQQALKRHTNYIKTIGIYKAGSLETEV